nr:glutamine synthetase family protein [Sulfitobacter algicola]
MNGQWRGKRVPGAKVGASARMPFSVLNVDIFGRDIEGSPLVFASGDADGLLQPTDRGAVPMPWLDGDAHLVPHWMFDESGQAFAGDPRQALARVLDRFSAKGWQVMAATEIEFHLLSNAQGPIENPVTGHALVHDNILSLNELDQFEPFFNDLYASFAAMGIPAQAATSEAGPGQFEIDLTHQPAMRAADDAALFKMLVKGVARNHDMAATFMAKPITDAPGNGMHVHFSVLDTDGRNIFDDGGNQGTAVLRHAIAGCLAAMPAQTLFFAPFGASFDRLVPGAHAPTGAAWGFDNRTVAVRVPAGPPAARRIEHRVAGGDTNPYLVLAAVLGAALQGIEAGTMPPAPVIGDAYDLKLPQLADSWDQAIAALADPILFGIFHTDLLDNLRRTKQQELRSFADIPHDNWMPHLLEVL